MLVLRQPPFRQDHVETISSGPTATVDGSPGSISQAPDDGAVPKRTLAIAHRGASAEFPENTIPAFARALELGADGIELDVHTTGDGIVVVHHDFDVQVGASRLPIAAASLAELRALQPSDEHRIPTLREVCELVGSRATLYVELKGADVEEAVLDTLRDHVGPFALHSFDHAAIERVAARAPHVRRGLLFDAPPAELVALVTRTGAHELWPRFDLATPEFIATAHALGTSVIAWTVNDSSIAARLTAAGVDGICTDDVRALPAAVAAPAPEVEVLAVP